MGVGGQDDEIRELPRRDRTLDMFLERSARAVDGAYADGLINGDALVGVPDPALGSRAQEGQRLITKNPPGGVEKAPT